MSDFEYQLLCHTSPTLAGIKVSNLFSFPKEQLPQYRQEIKYYNAQMKERDLCIDYIYSCSGRIFVLVYRKKRLKDTLSHSKTASFLMSEGYPDPRSSDLAQIINQLRRRTNHCQEFPHEIGFFLGYPAWNSSIRRGAITSFAVTGRYTSTRNRHGKPFLHTAAPALAFWKKHGPEVRFSH